MVNNLVIPENTPEAVKQAYFDMVEKAKDFPDTQSKVIVCTEEDWEFVKSTLNKG